MRIEKIFNVLTSVLFYTIVIFVPGFFGYFSMENNLFELPKMVLFRMLILLLLISYCYQQFFSRNNEKKVSIFKQKEFFVPTAIVVFLFFHSLFLSINSTNSLYGLYDRQQGLISLIFYFLFFYLFVKTFQTKPINSILNAILFSSLLVSVYGFFQWFGIDFVNWTESASTTHRIFSSLGQPVFLGSFIVLTIPVSFYLLFVSKYWLKSFFYFLAIIAQCLALFLTYSLTAWISLVFGAILIYAFLIYYSYFYKKSEETKLLKKKIILSGCLMLLLISGLLLYGWQKDWVLKNKIGTLVDLRGGSMQSRIILWRASFSAIKERPLFGYGLENQGEILVKYYDQKWAEVEYVNMLSNRAHNILFDVLLTTGISGLIIFLSVSILVFKLAYNNYRDNRQPLLSVFLAVAALSFLFSLQFSFLFVTAGVYLTLYVGILFVINNSRPKYADVAEENSKLNKSKKSIETETVFKITIFLGMILMLASLIYGNFKKLIADQYYRSILQSNHDGSFFAQISLYDYIVNLGRTDVFYHQQFILLMNDAYRNPANQKLQLSEVKNRVERLARKMNSKSFSEKLAKARAYSILSINDKNNYEISKKLYQELITYSPGWPLLYFEIGSLCQNQKDYSEAEKYYLDFLSSLPDLASPLLNPDHKQAVLRERVKGLLYLGNITIEQGELEKAKKYYLQAQAIDEKNPLVYYKISRVFYLQNDFQQAISYGKKAIEVDPTNYFFPYAVALIYKESGNKSEAQKYADQALGLNPEAAEVIKLSKELSQ